VGGGGTREQRKEGGRRVSGASGTGYRAHTQARMLQNIKSWFFSVTCVTCHAQKGSSSQHGHSHVPLGPRTREKAVETSLTLCPRVSCRNRLFSPVLPLILKAHGPAAPTRCSSLSIHHPPPPLLPPLRLCHRVHSGSDVSNPQPLADFARHRYRSSTLNLCRSSPTVVWSLK